MSDCTAKTTKDRPPRLGLVGPCPPPWGGTTVLFQHLLDEMSKRKIAYEAVPVPVNPKGLLRKLIGGVILTWRLFRCFTRTDVVSVHLSTSQLTTLGLLTIVFAKLLRRPLILRKFGGRDAAQLDTVSRCFSAIVLRKSTLVLVESRGQCREIKDWLGVDACWYPNNRPLRPIVRRAHTRTKRHFVYVGQVRRQKGIQEIIAAVESLEGKCVLDVYGPFFEGMGIQTFRECKYVHYKGVLGHQSVTDVLADYDAFVCPTYWPGEGYPGVIIEGLLAGIPIVTTRWRFVPELVDCSCGLLVPPKDPDALRAALIRLIKEDNLKERLGAGARARSREFSTEKWTDVFLRINQAVYEWRTDTQGLVDDIRISKLLNLTELS